MSYRVRVERHSISPRKQQLVSFVARFPRIVLAEAVTHRLTYDTGECEISWVERNATRDISKNSASSRAIPLWKMIKAVWERPYVPESFSIAGPGMQAAGYMIGQDQIRSKEQWLHARDYAIGQALNMSDTVTQEQVFTKLGGEFTTIFSRYLLAEPLMVGVHKQEVNRLLEPWGWVTQLLTATGEAWANYFALRCDSAAHPAIRRIARMMYLALRMSRPTELDYGQWHLPFSDPTEPLFSWIPPGPHLAARGPVEIPDPIKFSAARAGWVSYENHDKDGSPEALRRTFAAFVGGFPKHGSPVEHQATPLHQAWEVSYPHLCSNLRGWLQARKLLAEEFVSEYRPSEETVASWGDLGPLWTPDEY